MTIYIALKYIMTRYSVMYVRRSVIPVAPKHDFQRLALKPKLVLGLASDPNINPVEPAPIPH